MKVHLNTYRIANQILQQTGGGLPLPTKGARTGIIAEAKLSSALQDIPTSEIVAVGKELIVIGNTSRDLATEANDWASEITEGLLSHTREQEPGLLAHLQTGAQPFEETHLQSLLESLVINHPEMLQSLLQTKQKEFMALFEMTLDFLIDDPVHGEVAQKAKKFFRRGFRTISRKSTGTSLLKTPPHAFPDPTQIVAEMARYGKQAIENGDSLSAVLNFTRASSVATGAGHSMPSDFTEDIVFDSVNLIDISSPIELRVQKGEPPIAIARGLYVGYTNELTLAPQIEYIEKQLESDGPVLVHIPDLRKNDLEMLLFASMQRHRFRDIVCNIDGRTEMTSILTVVLKDTGPDECTFLVSANDYRTPASNRSNEAIVASHQRIARNSPYGKPKVEPAFYELRDEVDYIEAELELFRELKNDLDQISKADDVREYLIGIIDEGLISHLKIVDAEFDRLLDNEVVEITSRCIARTKRSSGELILDSSPPERGTNTFYLLSSQELKRALEVISDDHIGSIHKIFKWNIASAIEDLADQVGRIRHSLSSSKASARVIMSEYNGRLKTALLSRTENVSKPDRKISIQQAADESSPSFDEQSSMLSIPVADADTLVKAGPVEDAENAHSARAIEIGNTIDRLLEA